MLRYRLTVAALVVASLALHAAASAAPTGLAYDAVTKFSMNADAAAQQPGDFNADFAAAAASQMPEQSNGGGLFGRIAQAMTMGQNMQQIMKTGIAERHYVAGSKERTDNLSTQTATIIDCSARTITTLDLRRKTYKTVSMDQSSSSDGKGGSSGSGMRDNDTRVAVTVTNTAIGPRTISGQPTSGYRSDITVTETNASGESHTQNGNMVGYYSSYSNPVLACSRAGTPNGPMGPPMVGNWAQLMRALAASGVDNRFSVKQSGPPLPLGKLAMFSSTTFTGGQGGGMTFSNERGNVRSITADDPAFAIPADFTQQQ